MTYKDDQENKIRVRTIKGSFIVLTLLFVLLLVGFGFVLNDVKDLSNRTAKLTKVTARLTIENTKRIKEIQASRVSSCRQTYAGVRKVVKKLLPKNPTREQRINIEKFDAIIDNLREGCKKQTSPKAGGA